MDIFEEVVKLRHTGKRGALATIVHTNGSIPSYESSRMLVREDGTIAGTIGGGCVEGGSVGGGERSDAGGSAARKMTFSLNNEANLRQRPDLRRHALKYSSRRPILPQPMLYIFGGGHVSIALANAAQHTAGFAIGVVDGSRELVREQGTLSDGAGNSYQLRGSV